MIISGIKIIYLNRTSFHSHNPMKYFVTRRRSEANYLYYRSHSTDHG